MYAVSYTKYAHETFCLNGSYVFLLLLLLSAAVAVSAADITICVGRWFDRVLSLWLVAIYAQTRIYFNIISYQNQFPSLFASHSAWFFPLQREKDGEKKCVWFRRVFVCTLVFIHFSQAFCHHFWSFTPIPLCVLFITNKYYTHIRFTDFFSHFHRRKVWIFASAAYCLWQLLLCFFV